MSLNNNLRQFITKSLNAHNAKVFSGIEQIFVVQLRQAYEKRNLIQKYIKGVYQDSDYEVIEKIAINDYDSVAGDRIKTDADTDDESGNNQDKKTLFDCTWVVPIDPKKSKFNVKSQGQYKGKSYLSEVSVFVRGAGRISVEFFNSLLDYEIALIFKDANGNFRLLFDPVYPVELDVEQDSGEGIASDAGFTVKFTNESKLPPLFLYGYFDVASAISRDSSKLEVEPLSKVYTGRRSDLFLSGTAYQIEQTGGTESGI